MDTIEISSRLASTGTQQSVQVYDRAARLRNLDGRPAGTALKSVDKVSLSQVAKTTSQAGADASLGLSIAAVAVGVAGVATAQPEVIAVAAYMERGAAGAGFVATAADTYLASNGQESWGSVALDVAGLTAGGSGIGLTAKGFGEAAIGTDQVAAGIAGVSVGGASGSAGPEPTVHHGEGGRGDRLPAY